MKIVTDTDVPESYEGALQLERQGEWKLAAALYEKLSKKFKQEVRLVHRLMIVYRKLKNSEKELASINRAILLYEAQHLSLKKVAPAAAAISKKLNIMLGHTDKKGKKLFTTTEVERLEKRKQGLLKKIK